MELLDRSCHNKSLTLADIAQPYQLVSLWDMLDLHAQRFINILLGVSRVNILLGLHGKSLDSNYPMIPVIEQIYDELLWLHNALKEIELIGAMGNVERIINLYNNQNEIRAGVELETLIGGLLNTVVDELRGKIFMMVPYSKARYFEEPTAIFSEKIRDAFPSADYDMTEACKCFAFDRHTSCVFHSMRVLEVGLNALAASLGISIATNWNKALDQIEKEIRSRNTKTPGPDWKAIDEPFYSEAATHFRMVKNAWRNHTMHIKEHYDEERSSDILSSVSSLMRHLADRLQE